MCDTITTPAAISGTIPAELADEVGDLAERYPLGVRVEPAESDLPGFDYYETFATMDVEGESVDPEGEMGEEFRVGGRLVLTLTGGRAVTLDEQETADVMWALAVATRRNRKHTRSADVGQGHDPQRVERFARQQAVMAKIADAEPVT